jgi:hypothetical protein
MNFFSQFFSRKKAAKLVSAQEPQVVKPVMSEDDMESIRNYAMNNDGRDVAVRVYRKNLSIVGKTNNAMNFMAEVDTPSPDLTLRAH